MPYSLVKYNIMLGISPRLASLSKASFAATRTTLLAHIHHHTSAEKMVTFSLPMMKGKVLKPPLALLLCFLRRVSSIPFSISEMLSIATDTRGAG